VLTSFNAKGLLRPLEDVADAIGRDNIWEAIRGPCRFEGKYYGIPHSAATSLLIYRKDIFIGIIGDARRPYLRV